MTLTIMSIFGDEKEYEVDEFDICRFMARYYKIHTKEFKKAIYDLCLEGIINEKELSEWIEFRTWVEFNCEEK